MGYTVPRSLDVGDDMTVPIWHTDLRDNIIALRAGEIAVPSAVAGDDVYCSSASQLAAGARQLRQTFRGLVSRTHPDADKAAYQCLANCEAAVMDDGGQVENWSNILFDITASGAGGLDTGTEQASTWYQKYLIRKSSDGTKAGLLHRAKNYAIDSSVLGINTSSAVRYSAAAGAVGQGITPVNSGVVPFVDFNLAKVGSPTGKIWIELRTNNSGVPSGTVLATSDKLDVSLVSTTAHWVRFAFRSPVTLTAGTLYHLVITGDWTASAVNYVAVSGDSTSPYAGGICTRENAPAWGSLAMDATFRYYVTQNDTAVTMPTGYDQRCLIGWAYNDGGSNLVRFMARDRAVQQTGRAILSGVSNPIATLTDISSAVPPCAVSVTGMQLANNVASTKVAIITPDTKLSQTDVGCYWSTNYYAFVDVPCNLPIEFQHFYNYQDTGSVFYCYINGWRW